MIGHAPQGKTPDDEGYDWADATRTELIKSDKRLRITETERKTKEYLTKFRDMTGIGCTQ